MPSGKDLYESYKRKTEPRLYGSDVNFTMPKMDNAQSTAAMTDEANPAIEFPKGMLQGSIRSVFVTAQTIAAAALGMTPDELAKIQYQPKGVGALLMGDQPVGLKSEGADFATMFGVDEKYANEVGVIAIAGFTALDFLTGGQARNVKTALKNASEISDAAKVMRSVGFEEDIVSEYAGIFAKTTTDKEIGEALEAAIRLQETTRRAMTNPLRAVDGADIVTVGGRALDEEVEAIRTALVRTIDEVGNETMKRIRDDLETATVPTMRQFDEATEALRSQDEALVPPSLAAKMEDVRSTVKVEPERFVMDAAPKYSDIRGASNVGVDTIPIKDATYLTSGKLDVTKIPDGGRLVIDDATYKREGDVFVKGVRDEVPRDILIDDNTYIKQGDVFVKGSKSDVANVPIADATYKKSGEIPVVRDNTKALAPEEVVVKPETPKVELPAKKPLDEVANPLRENLGILSVNVQERYGKAVVTKAKAAKFAAAEQKVFNEIAKYLEEVAYVAKRGGEMVQVVPKWIPLELRDATVYQNVIDLLQRGSLPASHGSKEMALYTAMVDEVARRSGIVKAGPKPAINPDGAILEATRNRLRTPGDKTNPLVKSEPKAGSEPVDESLSFEKAEGSQFLDDFADEDEVNRAYKEYSETKTSSGKTGKKGGKKDQTKPYGIDLSILQDTTKFKSVFRDMYRNAEKVFGDQWPVIKQKIFDPFDAAKGRMVDEEKVLTDALQSKIVKGLGIAKGSKLSRAVMDFGEGATDYASLVQKFGKEKADRVVEAATWFRTQYDRMIDEVNAVQREIYPNDPSKITPKRKDYFRHYDEMSLGFTNMFEDVNLGNLPSTLRPDDSRNAKSKWQSFKQKRLGNLSKRDAVGGFLNYVPQFTYTKHIDPQTARMREFVKDLEAGTETSKNLGNFIEGTRKWVDDLAGQANFVDRFAEYVPGGRSTLGVVDFMNKRAKRNAILGNFGASISQIFNVPGAIASAGPAHSTKAVLRTMGEIMHTTDVLPGWEQGVFIKERYRNSMYSQFDTKLIDQPMKLASWMLGVLDEVGTKFAWNAHYEKALTEGMVDAVKYADDMTRKAVAGRGVGEVPVLQKSKVFQTVAPFQLEVMNQWWLMKDFVDQKDFAKFATLFASYFIFNEVSEEIKGSSVGFDPVQAFYDSYKIYEDELLEPADKTKRIVGRLSGEVLTNVPLGSYAVAAGANAMGMDDAARKEFFGAGDPVRFGNAPLVWNAVTDPLFGIMPRWGGAQMEKTWGGLRALAEGKVRDKDGKVMYDVPVEPGVGGALQNIMFGPRATNFEYRESIENEMRSFYKANITAVANGQVEQVKADLAELPENLKPIYIKVAKEEKKLEEQIAVKAMVPTYLIASALVKEGKKAEAKVILDGLDEKEKELYLQAAKQWKNKDLVASPVPKGPEEKKTFNDYLPLLMQRRDTESQRVSPNADAWVIQTALDFAYAFGTNPQQAFEIVFLNNDIIRDTIGGTDGVVRTERMPLKDGEVLEGSGPVKEALLKKEGIKNPAKGAYFLEHKIPLGIGGSNEANNLFISTKAEHDAWTDAENLLIDAVKAGTIDYKTAQELIVRHKGYGETPITLEEIRDLINNK